jgi:hypothetical protein
MLGVRVTLKSYIKKLRYIKFPPIKRIREITAIKEEEVTSSQAPSTSKDSEKRSKSKNFRF